MGRRSKATIARLNNLKETCKPLSIISYANRAARFISAYGRGLSGPEAAWANRKYHGRRTFPPELATKLKK